MSDTEKITDSSIQIDRASDNSDDIEQYYFECICHSFEHILRFCFIKETDKEIPWTDLSAEIHLTQYKNIFKRAWYALKYVFGFKSAYGCFGCWNLNPCDIDRLRILLEYFRNEECKLRQEQKVYIVCPVRDAAPEITQEIQEYVDGLEKEGLDVHFPPRDVEQEDPTGGYRICSEHLAAMIDCNEVHIFWDKDSKGSHFDVGMAFALNKKMKLVKAFHKDGEGKSYHKAIQKIEELGCRR